MIQYLYSSDPLPTESIRWDLPNARRGLRSMCDAVGPAESGVGLMVTSCSHVPGWGPHTTSTPPRVGPHMPRVGDSSHTKIMRPHLAPGASRVRPQGRPRGGGVPGLPSQSH